MSAVNWGGVAFYILIAAVIIVAVAYFVWPDGIIHVTLASWAATISANIGMANFRFDLSGILKWIQENTVVSGLIATLGTAALGAVVKNYLTNRTLDKKVEELANTKLELANIASNTTKDQQTIAELQKQIETYNSDTTASELQKRISSFNDTLLQKEATIQSLRTQNQDLMNRIEATPVKIVTVTK